MSYKADLCYRFEVDGYIFETYNRSPDFAFKQIAQTHSAKVSEYVDDSFDESFNESAECDGIVSFRDTPPALGIKTADCLAIGIVGHSGIAILHAGWRGLHKKIISHSLIEKIDPRFFIISPHISASNYEVGEEFLDYFDQNISLDRIAGKLVFSQRNEAVHQIRSRFPDVPIEVSHLCTFDSDMLHSYRREKGAGRNVSILRKIVD
jgi:copper oxidase (laccase) domain-containing protein